MASDETDSGGSTSAVPAAGGTALQTSETAVTSAAGRPTASSRAQTDATRSRASRPPEDPTEPLPRYARGGYFALSMGAAFGTGTVGVTADVPTWTGVPTSLALDYGAGLAYGMTAGKDWAVWRGLTMGFAIAYNGTLQKETDNGFTSYSTSDVGLFSFAGSAMFVPAYTLARHHRFFLGVGLNVSGYSASYLDSDGNNYRGARFEGVGFSFNMGYAYRREGVDPFVRFSKIANGVPSPLLLEVGIQL